MRDPIFRAFKTIEALSRRDGVTTIELADILGFGGTRQTRYSLGRYWIDMASLHYPVVEKGFRANGMAGRNPVVYGMM